MDIGNHFGFVQDRDRDEYMFTRILVNHTQKSEGQVGEPALFSLFFYRTISLYAAIPKIKTGISMFDTPKVYGIRVFFVNNVFFFFKLTLHLPS